MLYVDLRAGWMQIEPGCLSNIAMPMYFYLGLQEEPASKSYIRILQPLKEDIQHFKTTHFFTYFFFCGHFALLDPDPDTVHQNLCGSSF